MRTIRWLFIAILIAIAAWRLWPHLSDFKSAAKLKDQIQYQWVVFALMSQIGQYIGDGWLSQILLKIEGFKINFTDTLKIASINVFAAHILPVGEAGVVATTYFSYRKLGVSTQGVIFLAITWSIFTNFVLALLFIFSLIFLPNIPNFPVHISFVSTAAIVTLIFLIFIILVYHNRILPYIKRKFSDNFIYKEIVKFKNNLSAYKGNLLSHKSKIPLAIFAASIYYLSNVATLTFSFLAFGYLPSIPVVTFAYTVSLIAGWITLAPAGIGATEATLLLIFLAFGIDPATTVGAILIFRLITFWLPIPAGAISYMSLKKVQP